MEKLFYDFDSVSYASLLQRKYRDFPIYVCGCTRPDEECTFSCSVVFVLYQTYLHDSWNPINIVLKLKIILKGYFLESSFLETIQGVVICFITLDKHVDL